LILTIDQLSCYRPGCGVHLRKTDQLTEALARLKDLSDPWPVTSGVRNESDIQRQRRWPSDAVFVSPVKETPNHVGMTPLGWGRFSELVSMLGVPAFALGGLCLDDLAEVTNYFGYGIAGIRGFQGASDSGSL
jgi:thiamine monophosphate synthase